MSSWTFSGPPPAWTCRFFFTGFAPTVARYPSENWSNTKRRTRELLPTAASPSKAAANLCTAWKEPGRYLILARRCPMLPSFEVAELPLEDLLDDVRESWNPIQGTTAVRSVHS